MQQAHYQCRRPTTLMKESVSIHKSPTPTQAFAHESSKVGGRKKRGRETEKTGVRRLMERKAAQKNKNTLEELKQGLPIGTAMVNKVG